MHASERGEARQDELSHRSRTRSHSDDGIARSREGT
jgi:hypothetical protein